MLLTVLYIIGITAEAMTGALAAGRRKMDLFGVIIIASVTAIGGGSVRDMLLGHYPLGWVKHPEYIMIVAAAAVITTVVAPLMTHLRKVFRCWMRWARWSSLLLALRSRWIWDMLLLSRRSARSSPVSSAAFCAICSATAFRWYFRRAVRRYRFCRGLALYPAAKTPLSHETVIIITLLFGFYRACWRCVFGLGCPFSIIRIQNINCRLYGGACGCRGIYSRTGRRLLLLNKCNQFSDLFIPQPVFDSLR